MVEDRRSPDVSISMDFHGGSHVHGSRDYRLCHTQESVGRGAPCFNLGGIITHKGCLKFRKRYLEFETLSSFYAGFVQNLLKTYNHLLFRPYMGKGMIYIPFSLPGSA